MNIVTKADIGTEIFYIMQGRVHSAKVQYLNVHVENAYSNRVSPKAKVLYKTSHGEIDESDAFLSREEIANAIIEGKL